MHRIPTFALWAEITNTALKMWKRFIILFGLLFLNKYSEAIRNKSLWDKSQALSNEGILFVHSVNMFHLLSFQSADNSSVLFSVELSLVNVCGVEDLWRLLTKSGKRGRLAGQVNIRWGFYLVQHRTWIFFQVHCGIKMRYLKEFNFLRSISWKRAILSIVLTIFVTAKNH